MIDENDYPIMVILPFNSGGNAGIAQDLIRALTPDRMGYEAASIRISNGGQLAAQYLIGQQLYNPETCSDRTSNGKLDWYTSPVTVDYGNEVHHVMTQPSQYFVTAGMTRKLKKHIRKATEIAIFTDGFCFAECAMFIKGMKQRGMGVTIGCGDDIQSEDVYDDG